MNLTRAELSVMELAKGSDISTIEGERADDWRTFGDVDRARLLELTEQHAGYVKNGTVDRLPDVDALGDFLTDYPFFRVHGFFHNLSVNDPIEVYFTGIEFVPCTDMPLMSFDPSELLTLKERFTNLFYNADYLHVEDSQMVAEYYFERPLETTN